MLQGVGFVANVLRKSNLSFGLPLICGGLKLSLISNENIFSIMPFKGKNIEVSKKLQDHLDLSLPNPNQKVSVSKMQIIWTGLDQWFIINCKSLDLQNLLSHCAAITDQTDGWVRLLLNDTHNYDVMARLCPVEPALNKIIKTQVAGMMALVSFDKSGVEMFFMRSMIETAIIEIELSMKSINAQKLKYG